MTGRMQHIAHYHTTALLGVCVRRYIVFNQEEELTQHETSLTMTERIGLTVASDQAVTRCHFLSATSSTSFESSFNEQSNQRDTRQTLTKHRQCLSDGPNVTDLRAAVCEGQA